MTGPLLISWEVKGDGHLTNSHLGGTVVWRTYFGQEREIRKLGYHLPRKIKIFHLGWDLIHTTQPIYSVHLSREPLLGVWSVLRYDLHSSDLRSRYCSPSQSHINVFTLLRYWYCPVPTVVSRLVQWTLNSFWRYKTVRSVSLLNVSSWINLCPTSP